MTTRIAHLSDIHFGSEADGSAADLAQALNAASYDLVVLSGDLTMGARHGEFAAARAFMEALAAPTLAVPGNHDITPYRLAERFLAPYRRWHAHISPVIEPQWSNKDVAVVGINTARRVRFGLDWSLGALSGHQLAALPARFEGTDTPVRIIVAHHPFLPDTAPDLHPRSRIMVRGAKRALAAFADLRVDLVLAGHLHHTYAAHHTPPAGGHTVTIIQAGTALSSRVRGEPHSFNHIEMDESGTTVTAVTLETHGRWRRKAGPLTALTRAPKPNKLSPPEQSVGT